MAACAALVVVLALCAWKAGERDGAKAVVVALAALSIPACWIAAAPGLALRELSFVFVAVVAGLSTAALDRPRNLQRAGAVALAGAAGAVALHGIYQRLLGFGRLAERLRLEEGVPDRDLVIARLEQNRAYASFSTPSGLGGFLVLAIPVTAGLALASRGRRRLGWAGLLSLELGGLVAAASATAVAALVAALVLALLAWRGGRRAGWAGLVLAIALLGTVGALRGEEVLSASHSNSPWRLRAGNFAAAWAMASDHPWTGVGPGGFGERYSAYRRPGDNETRHVHSLPLETAAELGWVGGPVISLTFFVLFLGPLAGSGSEPVPWRRGAALGLAAFALHNLADFTAYMPSVLWSASVLRGLTARKAIAAPAAPRSPARAVAGAGLAVAIAFALVAILTGPSANSRHEARVAALAGRPDRAESLALRSTRLTPWDPDAALLLARITSRNPLPKEAGPERLALTAGRAERAVRLAPFRAAAREVRARSRLARGDYAGAYADMVRASNLYPTHEEYARGRDRLAAVVQRAAAGARPSSP